MSRHIDQECLANVASMYFEAHARTGDHRQAFVETIRTALLAGYQPYAAWVTDAMLRTGRPAFTVALSHPEAEQVFPVIVGGVSIGWGVSLMCEAYTPETGCGWRRVEGEALNRYMRWARQEPEPEPPQIEMDFAMRMEP